MQANNILKKLFRNKSFSVKAEGTSMSPVLHPKDTLFFRKTNYQNIQVNDIIMVEKFRHYLVHRVIYKNNKFLVTKGDNNQNSDGTIKPHQIFGKLIKVQRTNQQFHPDSIYLLQSAHYFKEIIKIKRQFEKAGIDYVFLKGLPLHLYYEKSIPRRIYADCDILVNQVDYRKIHKILTENKYQKIDTSYSAIHRKLKNKLTSIVYFSSRKKFRFVFDIHLQPVFLMNQVGKLDELYPEYLLELLTKEFLRSKRNIKISNSAFPILAAKNLIIYLSLHFFHHNYRGIFRLEQIKNIILEETAVIKNKEKLSLWFGLSEDIVKYRLKNYIYPVFIMLKKYFKINTPEKFIRNIKPDHKYIHYIKNNIYNDLIFSGSYRTEEGVTRFKNIFYLSELPFVRKICVFLNPSVAYSIYWVIINKLKISLFRKIKYPHNETG